MKRTTGQRVFLGVWMLWSAWSCLAGLGEGWTALSGAASFALPLFVLQFILFGSLNPSVALNAPFQEGQR